MSPQTAVFTFVKVNFPALLFFTDAPDTSIRNSQIANHKLVSFLKTVCLHYKATFENLQLSPHTHVISPSLFARSGCVASTLTRIGAVAPRKSNAPMAQSQSEIQVFLSDSVFDLKQQL